VGRQRASQRDPCSDPRRRVARAWSMDTSTVDSQLLRMERDGLLVSRNVGRTRVFEFNPRHACRDEVKALLMKAIGLLPRDVLEQLPLHRVRPRRTGKPL